MVHLGASTRLADSPARRPLYLLEAYVPLTSTAIDPVGELIAAITAAEGVTILGTVVIPSDESMLCVVEATSRDSADTLVRRIGRDAIRIVEVRWLPSRDR